MKAANPVWIIFSILGLLTCGSFADTYRFNSAVGNNWMEGQNWQNQTAGTSGWLVGGIPLPDADDSVRFNYGGASGTLSTNAGTIDALQIGVDEGGHLTLENGAVLTTDTGEWSGMGAGKACTGSLTLNGGLLTVSNGWAMGYSTNAYTVSLTINGGQMRVASGGFTQTKATTTPSTTLNGGILSVNSLALSSGSINITEGILNIDGNVTNSVAAWKSAGRLLAYGGAIGGVISSIFSNSVTTVWATMLPTVSTPNVIGLAQAVAESQIVAAGLVVGKKTLAWDLPGSPTPGTVYSQSPTGGTTVVTGSSVNLVIVAPQLAPPDTENLTPSTGISEGAFTTQTFDGRTVWVPSTASSMLYFKVPSTFSFVAGLPVYVRIEYYDSGRGMFSAQYDSNLGTNTSDRFHTSEVHSRSSRVGQGGFVYNYQMFEFPLFARRQNGQNDFRFTLSGNDGTPVRIASVQINNRPYNDEKFLYALSRPWLTPYDGPSLDLTDRSTLVGKVMTGYQGWFGTPNDADDKGWRHWGRSSGVDPSPSEITVDMWPWINEYRTNDLYAAGNMVLGDGRPAYLFSSRDPETVRRHFRWMRKHNIDGAYLQRFVSRSSSGYYGNPEFVLANVRAAANQEGRVWAIEYDVSSLESEANPLEVIQNDWNFLVNDCDILNDPRYAYENGKPVLFVWGFSLREISLANADAVIDWLKAQNLYLIAGVHSSWEKKTDWHDHYKKYDQLLAWMEKTQNDLISQKNKLTELGLKILPHAWPGFSWHNLQKTVYPTSYTARNGGRFYWTNLYNAVSIGADQIFLGMFDEYDEGTAVMPMSDNHPDIFTSLTNSWGHYLDNEGRDPFWYLRLSGAARDMLNGLRPVSSTLPSDSSVPQSAFAGEELSVRLGTNNISDGMTHTQPPDGLTRGAFVGGSACRTNLNSYFYFSIDDDLCYANSAGQAVTVEIDFYNGYSGTNFRLYYDGLTNAFTLHPFAVTPASVTGGWKSIRWTISDGYFGNRQNGSSDFRISFGTATAIRSVRIIFPEEMDSTSQPPQIQKSQTVLEWPVLSDAIGWRLHQTGNLLSNMWNEVSGPFVMTNGVMRYNAPQTNSSGFFRLQRPMRQ